MFVWLESSPYPVRIAFVTSKEEFDIFLKEHDYKRRDDWPEYQNAMAWWFKSPPHLTTYVIGLNPEKHDCWRHLASAVAHEATHVVQFLWRDIGEDNPGCEAEAYFVQALVKQILDMVEPPMRKAA